MPMTRSTVVLALVLTLTASSLVFAQSGPSVSHRVEASAEFGLTAIHPYVGYSAARTPPTYEPLEESSRALLAGFAFRVNETASTSTVVRVQWGRAGDVTVTTSGTTWSHPVIDYTLERSVDTRSFTVSVFQALDFRSGTSARPWLGAGFAVSRLSVDQQSTQTGVSDPRYHYTASESFGLTRVGPTFGGGARFYPANHLVIGAEAGMLWLFAGAKRTSGIYGKSGTWRVEPERRLFAVLQAGVAF
jgi:opacity protein-like surface antigen